jgi:hypothetical protein
VQLLDIVSKSLPDMLWLTDLEQKGSDVTIQGQSTTLIALSDFVGNLGGTPLLQKPIEIVDSKVETVAPTGQPDKSGAGVDLIKFTVRATLVNGPKTAAAAGGRGAGPAAPPAPPPGGRR